MHAWRFHAFGKFADQYQLDEYSKPETSPDEGHMGKVLVQVDTLNAD